MTYDIIVTKTTTAYEKTFLSRILGKRFANKTIESVSERIHSYQTISGAIRAMNTIGDWYPIDGIHRAWINASFPERRGWPTDKVCYVVANGNEISYRAFIDVSEG